MTEVATKFVQVSPVLSPDGNLVAAEVKTSPTFSVDRLVALFSAAEFVSNEGSPQYDVSFDDRRFLMIRSIDKLIVVENWFEELKAKSRK